MRTIIELPEDLRRAADEVGHMEGISRAELIRRALRHYLQQLPRRPDAVEMFGLWRGHERDGLGYQEQRRREWDERS